MSNRIAVMRAGRIHQIGPPRELYEDPNSRFVADFIGSANLLMGEVVGMEAGVVRVRLQSGGQTVAIEVEAGVSFPTGQSVTVMVRPEKMEAGRQAFGGPNELTGEVVDIAYLGDLSIYHVATAGGIKVQVAMANRQHRQGKPLERGEGVHLAWHPSDAVILTE